MSDDTRSDDERATALRAEHRERMVTNVVLLVIFAALIGAGIWLSNGMLEARRADECISAGRRNCNPIEMQR